MWRWGCIVADFETGVRGCALHTQAVLVVREGTRDAREIGCVHYLDNSDLGVMLLYLPLFVPGSHRSRVETFESGFNVVDGLDTVALDSRVIIKGTKKNCI